MVFLLFIPVFLLVGIRALFGLDPDFGWHLFLGQRMVETKTLIANAVGYNYFEKMPLIDHEWLSDIIFYTLYHKFGVWPLQILTLVGILLLGLLLINIICNQTKLTSARIIALSVTIFPLPYLFSGFRPQYLLFIFAALFIFLKQSVQDFRIRLIFYFLLILIGNNLHGGFITLLPIPFLLEAYPLRKSTLKKTVFKLAILVVVFLCALLINPNIQHYWLMIGDYFGDNYYRAQILEWHPLYSFPVRIWDIIALSTSIFFLFINKYFKKMPLNELVLILLYLFVGVRFVRYFPVAMIVAAPFLAKAAEDLFQEVSVSRRNQLILSLPIFLGLSCFVLLNLKGVQKSVLTDPFSAAGYPKEAAAYLQKDSDCRNQGNLLNPYDWGGYLIWVNNGGRVFIDGRGPQAQISDGAEKSILEEYNRFESDDPSTISEQLVKYNISCVLLDRRYYSIDSYSLLNKILLRYSHMTDEQLNKKNLLHYLEDSSSWSNIYQDNISAVYRKI